MKAVPMLRHCTLLCLGRRKEGCFRHFFLPSWIRHFSAPCHLGCPLPAHTRPLPLPCSFLRHPALSLSVSVSLGGRGLLSPGLPTPRLYPHTPLGLCFTL